MLLNMWTIHDWFQRRGFRVHSDISDDGALVESIDLTADSSLPDKSARLAQHDGGCTLRAQADCIRISDITLPEAARVFSEMQSFYNNWERDSLLSLINIRNPQSLVELAAGVFKRPICFKNTEELIFGQTPDFKPVAVPPNSGAKNSSRAKTATLQELRSAQKPLVHYSRFYNTTVAQANLWKKNENIGSIIILEQDMPFTKGDIYLLTCFASFMSTFILHDRSDLFSGNGTSSLLVDLARGKNISVENLQSIYTVKHWGLNDMFILLCFRDVFDGETPLKRSLRNTLKAEFPHCQLMFYEDVIGIINVTKTGTYDAVVKKLKSILPADNPPLGISFPFLGLERLNIYYRQAQLSIRHAQSLGLSFASTYDIALKYMTDSISNEPTGSHMLHPDVLHLLSIDQSDGTNYAHTLLCYLLSGGNYTDTAQKLKIHRNTAIYRMGKITEQMTTDLNDVSNQKLLIFSCLVLESHFRK